MEYFIQNYGQTLELPSYFVLDSTIYPLDNTFSLSLVAYGVPGVTSASEDQQKMRTYDLPEQAAEGQATRAVEADLADVFADDAYRFCSLLLMQRSGPTLQPVAEVPLHMGRKVKIEFSPDGRFLLVYYKQEWTLKVYAIEDGDVQACIRGISADRAPIYSRELKILSKLKKFRFSGDGSYLMCYGKE